MAKTIAFQQMGVRVHLDGPGNLKFLVFDHSNHSLLYVSAPKSFADDGMGWKYSDVMSFSLLAGRTYDIGAIADVSGLWTYDQRSETRNGITTIVSNPNFHNYDLPTAGDHATADGAVQLLAVVPEPSFKPGHR